LLICQRVNVARVRIPVSPLYSPENTVFSGLLFQVVCIVAFSISYNTDFHSSNSAVFLLSFFEYSNEIHSDSKYLITSKGMDYLNPCYCIN
jgi:hypothetical protein